MDNKLTIKKAKHRDTNTLAKLGRHTFTDTYAGKIPKHALKRYVLQHFNPKVIAGALREKKSGFSIAYIGGKPAGYSKINVSRNVQGKKDPRCSELEKLYVLKEFQGKGIGNALLKKFENAAKKRGNTFVWLGIWKKNKRAISFYKRHGYAEFSSRIFTIGKIRQKDPLFKKIF